MKADIPAENRALTTGDDRSAVETRHLTKSLGCLRRARNSLTQIQPFRMYECRVTGQIRAAQLLSGSRTVSAKKNYRGQAERDFEHSVNDKKPVRHAIYE